MLVLVADRTTDGDGINGISDPHRQNYMPTVEDSIRIAMVDGETDIDDGGTFGEHLADAVHAGKGLNMTVVRRALFNTFRMRFRLGERDRLTRLRRQAQRPTSMSEPDLAARVLTASCVRQGSSTRFPARSGCGLGWSR